MSEVAVAGAEKKLKLFQRFTAVDLVTLAVFAALYRACWYLWNALSFAFPFNQILNTLFYCLCGIAALMFVRKVGAASLYLIAAALINIFLQGESLAIAAVTLMLGVVADIYVLIFRSMGKDVFKSRTHMFIIAAILSFIHSFTLWVILFKMVFMVPLDDAIFYSVLASGLVAGFVGGVLGYYLGNKLKGLIG
jgi:hypothetical protein